MVTFNSRITKNGNIKISGQLRDILALVPNDRVTVTIDCDAPDELKMPEEYKLYCKTHQIKYVEHTDFSEEIIADADILYMTRVQRERFTDLMEYERVKNVYILRNKMLENTRPNLRILHPLPRVNEIAYDVDDNPKAYYFQQAQNGLYAREAILCDVLGITLEDVKNDILL